MLRKLITSFNMEINELKPHANKQKLENDDLNRAKDLTSCLEKFTQGQKNLNLLLRSQMCVYDRVGLGYNPLKKLYKNCFFKASPPIAPHLTFTYCNNNGHSSYSCKVRKCA